MLSYQQAGSPAFDKGFVTAWCGNLIPADLTGASFKGLNDLNTNFKGFLYAGLMIVKDEPYLIEYNVRMGDPECQTILPKLKTDFGLIIEACVNEKLETIDIEWSNDKSLCIVLCSKGYPDEYKKSIEIKNLNSIILKENELFFMLELKKVIQKFFQMVVEF